MSNQGSENGFILSLGTPYEELAIEGFVAKTHHVSSRPTVTRIQSMCCGLLRCCTNDISFCNHNSLLGPNMESKH